MGKFALIAVLLAALFGVTVAVFPEGGTALLVVIFVSGAVILLFRGFTEEKHFILTIFLVGLAVRLAFGLYIHLFDARDYFGPDATGYDFYSYRLLESWLGTGDLLDPLRTVERARNSPAWGMHYLVAALYFFTGRNLLAAQSFCAVFGAATAPMVYYCAHRMFLNKPAAKLAAWSVALLPTFVIWSSQLLKDGLVIFLLVLAMTMVLVLQEKFRYPAVVALVLALLGILSIRFYIFYMVVVAVVGSLILGTSTSAQAVARRGAVLVLVGFALTYLGVARTASSRYRAIREPGTHPAKPRWPGRVRLGLRRGLGCIDDRRCVDRTTGRIRVSNVRAVPLGSYQSAPVDRAAGDPVLVGLHPTRPRRAFVCRASPSAVGISDITVQRHADACLLVISGQCRNSLPPEDADPGVPFYLRRSGMADLSRGARESPHLDEDARPARRKSDSGPTSVDAALEVSMCGIAGQATTRENAIDQGIIGAMAEAIRHRGPDEDGFYIDAHAGLGMRRLSIIDLASGQQPIHNADRSKWLIFNGEIYNYQELRSGLESRGHKLYTKSDTEAVIELFDEYGVDALSHLRGMYAFAIWDAADRSLFLARDRVGKKPLLYAHRPNGDLIFGSEFQAVLAHPDVPRDVDYQAIDSYLSFGCVPAPLTAFKAIRKLEPGHWLKWKDGRVETQRYWLPDFSTKVRISEEDAIEETTRILREATRLRMISEVPLGAFLSGGVDSSTVVALMAAESSTPVKTFSIGFEEQDFSELKYARRVAEHVGAEHHEFIVRPDAMEVLPTLVEHYGEPFADSSALPTYYVARETRKHVTVALNGDGGDESFAGYERYAAMLIAERYNRVPAVLRRALVESTVNLLPSSEVRRSRVRDAKRFLAAAKLPRTDRYSRWMTTFTDTAKSELYTAEMAARLAGSGGSELLGDWFARANGSGVLDATLLTDQMTYLPNDLLVKVDIASMACSLEARSPFLDHKLIEFAASLPESLKMRRFETKSLLKKVAARLVPRDVVYRRKMGFGVPIGKWFRGEMKDFAHDVLTSRRATERGIIRPAESGRYLAEHVAGTRDHAFQIWTLLMLELWFQRFIDQ